MQLNLYDITSNPALAVKIDRTLDIPMPDGTRITGPKQMLSLFNAKGLDMSVLASEHCYLLCLDSKNRPIGIFLTAKGPVDGFLASTRDMLGGAILLNAACCILAHNHPSGDPAPSEEDAAMTEKAVKAFRLCGMDLLDHIIIGGQNRYYSMYQNMPRIWKESAVT